MSKEETKRDHKSDKRSKKREKPDVSEESRCHPSHHHPVLMNGHSNGLNGFAQPKVVCPEMCCFCFDVLVGHLTKTQTSRSPYFTNEELLVVCVSVFAWLFV